MPHIKYIITVIIVVSIIGLVYDLNHQDYWFNRVLVSGCDVSGTPIAVYLDLLNSDDQIVMDAIGKNCAEHEAKQKARWTEEAKLFRQWCSLQNPSKMSFEDYQKCNK